jgi:hypothetical protein
VYNLLARTLQNGLCPKVGSHHVRRKTLAVFVHRHFLSMFAFVMGAAPRKPCIASGSRDAFPCHAISMGANPHRG